MGLRGAVDRIRPLNHSKRRHHDRRLPRPPGLCVLLLALVTISSLRPLEVEARLHAARLLLRWDTAPFAGSMVTVVLPGAETRTEPLPSVPQGELLFDRLTSGLNRLELRDSDGRMLRAWSVYLASDLTTVAWLDAGTGTLAISPDHPDPFGNVRVWSQASLSALPGAGLEGFLDLTDVGSSAPLLLNGDSHGPASRLRRPSYGLQDDIVGVQVPLGALPPRSSDHGLRVDTDRYGRTSGSLLGMGGSGGLTLGTAALSFAAARSPLGSFEAEGAVSGLASDDAGPLGLTEGGLKENDLESIETRWTALLRPAGAGLLRLGFHAAGHSRRHYLQEFRSNFAHNPREDRSVLLASGEWEVPAGPALVSAGATYSRSYAETGDGRAYDRINNYRIGSIENDAVDGSAYGLYWYGGNGSSTRRAHLYNYYTQDLVSSWRFHGEAEATPIAGAPLRAGIEWRRTTWRWYEHLDPIVDSSIPPSAPTGFQYASYLGYSRDASDRADLPGHEAPRPRQTVLWADQALNLGPAKLEGGIRWTSFAADQRALRRLDRPLGADSALTAEDFRGKSTRAYADPSLGLHLNLGRRSHLWADAGRRHLLPPLGMLYFSPNLLLQLASRAMNAPLKSSRDMIFGNPALEPERTTSASLALGHEFAAGWNARLTLRIDRTKDTWVARRHPAGDGPTADSVAFFGNRGERRDRTLRLDLEARPWQPVRLLASYRLGSRETNVIEPTPLYRALLLPDGPAEGYGVRETAPLSPLWFDDGVDRGWFPSLLDRTHRVSLAWMSSLGPVAEGTPTGGLLSDVDLAVVFRAASGNPYTPTYIRQEGLMTGAQASPALTPGTPVDSNEDGRLDSSEIQSLRGPWSWQVDIGLRRPFRLFGQQLAAEFEVRNILNRTNPRLVYGATGKADDDGWLDSTEGGAYLRSLGSDAERFRDAYEERLDNPNRYEQGRFARIGLSWRI